MKIKRNLTGVLSRISGYCLLAAILLAGTTVSAQKTGKLTAEEVVAKHLDSIGTAEARAAAGGRVVIGTCNASFKGRGAGIAEGITVLASDSNKGLIGMRFNNPEYPHEKVGYDGQDYTVSYVRPGFRSLLGEFLLRNEVLLKEGIMAGTLSSAWSLLDLSARKPKLEYAGMKKIGDLQVHELKYFARKGSDLKTSLFFDAATFQHVRTVYESRIAARVGASIDSSAGLRETRYKMVEDFSNFSKEGGLTLPHIYKLQLNIESTNGSIQYDWTSELKQFSFKQSLDANQFNAST